MSAVIELTYVTKQYGAHTALADVSLTVPSGVVFALLGENGAGKTTAIKLMLGLTEPTRGDVRVLGLDSRRDGFEIRRRVGYLPERPTLYEWMTAAEIGWFTAGFYSDGFEQEFRTLVTGFRVPLDRKLSQLSKGMREVALSLAMAHRPELLVLDEPTSGLDTMVRREFLESMVDIAAEGRTVLLSSHQISEVERVADVVAIVHGGRLLTVERLDQMKESTRQLTVTVHDAASSPLPLIAGTVIHQRRRGRQWDVLVRGLEEASLERLRFAEGIVAVESRTPSLEEIFVAYMTASPTSQPPTASPVTTNLTH